MESKVERARALRRLLRAASLEGCSGQEVPRLKPITAPARIIEISTPNDHKATTFHPDFKVVGTVSGSSYKKNL